MNKPFAIGFSTKDYTAVMILNSAGDNFRCRCRAVIEGIIVRVAQKLEQRKVGMLNLMAVFNKRYGEHASFKYFSFEKKDGVAVEESRKNAVDAFSKEITKMIGKEFLYGPIDLLTTKYIQIFQKKLEEKGISLRLKQAINIKVIS